MTKTLRVLIAEDSEDDTLLAVRELSRGGYNATYKRVETAPEFDDALSNGEWDLVIADYSMPQFNGLDALEIFKRKAINIPFIILSGHIGEDIAVNALKTGANDYVMKNNIIRLLPAIERGLYETELLQEKKNSENALRTSLQEKEQLLRDRELLLKEIHHRVKNNLQIVASLLKLQANSTKDETVRNMLNVSQNRVKSMSLIHEKLYQSQNLSGINFGDYLKNITEHLLNVYGMRNGEVCIDVQALDVSLEIDTAIPCGLIINEIISNSLKYAFPDGRKGKISVNISLADDTLTLIVSDNGIGMPEHIDFNKTNTLGLQLVNTLVRQLEGTVEIQRNPGTTFTIRFTKPKEKVRV
jgi:two-component sensor histidine kinase